MLGGLMFHVPDKAAILAIVAAAAATRRRSTAAASATDTSKASDSNSPAHTCRHTAAKSPDYICGRGQTSRSVTTNHTATAA